MADTASEEDILLAKRIISAAERHDVPALQVLLKEGSANVQDPTATVATSPLHAAIASCGKSEIVKEAGDDAIKTVELLLENGAIWNDLNKEDETPGCIALRLGQKKIYEMMVEAGIRAELLFSKMEELGLGGDDEAVEEVDEETREEQPAAKKQKVSEEDAKAIQEAVEEKVLDDVSLDKSLKMSFRDITRSRLLRWTCTKQASIQSGRTLQSPQVCMVATSGREREGRTGRSTCINCLSIPSLNRAHWRSATDA